jgi:hypothetical protein
VGVSVESRRPPAVSSDEISRTRKFEKKGLPKHLDIRSISMVNLLHTQMPKHSSPKSRTVTIGTKVTPAMHRALEHEASTSGTTVSALLHEVLVQSMPTPMEPAEELTLEDI